MAVLYFVLLVFAAVCFLVAAFAEPRVPRVNLIALGLLSWVLVVLIRQGQNL